MSKDFYRHSADGGIWERFTNAISGGGIFRTIIRLIALFSALIILGLNKIQCSLNYVGNNDVHGLDKLLIFYDAMKYGYERASILLWSELENFTVENLQNWGDMFILLMFILFVFFALYSFVSIIADFFDGDVKDKAPKFIKVVITLGMMLVFSATLFYTTDKPEGAFAVNSGLVLTNSEKETCKSTGELSYFVSVDEMSSNVVGINNNNNIIGVNDTTLNNIVNQTQNTIINNSMINNTNQQPVDKSIELINMLNN